MKLGAVISQAAILLTVSAAAATVTELGHFAVKGHWRISLLPKPDLFEVTVEQVEARWNGDVVWIDARRQEDFDSEHQEGALNLSQEAWNDQLFEHFETLASAGKPVVVYCDAAACALSKKVAEELRNVGISEVYHLKGGWPALKNSSQ